MRWQQEIHEILEKANWPPKASDLAASPWPKIVALALIGWAVAEVLAQISESVRRSWDDSDA